MCYYCDIFRTLCVIYVKEIKILRNTYFSFYYLSFWCILVIFYIYVKINKRYKIIKLSNLNQYENKVLK